MMQDFVTTIQEKRDREYRIQPVVRLAIFVFMLLLLLYITAPPAIAHVVIQDNEHRVKVTGVDEASVDTSIYPNPDYDCAVVTTIPAAECSGLVSLYLATDGANWHDNAGWLSGTDPCGWMGVVCEGGFVRELYLERNNLTGELPPDISGLHELIKLHLSHNALIGSIPEALYSLHHLHTLYLDNNELSGEIASSIIGLEALGKLNLSHNKLTGEIPLTLTMLSNLGGLCLSYNELTGPIPPELGTMQHLYELALSSNQLTGPIPPDLGQLPHLESLFLGHNELTGPIPQELGALENLQYLGLDANSLQGEIPRTLLNLSRLKDLVLSYNELTGMIPSNMDALTELVYLNFEYNQLSGDIPAELGNLPKLIELRLNENQLTGGIPVELGNLIALEALNLGNNQLTGEIPVELASLETLYYLGLYGNNLDGEIPVALSNLTNLRNLTLSYNSLTGNMPIEITHLSELTYLDLEYNQLSGRIPPEIGNLQKLVGLKLNDNQLTGSIPNTLGDLSALTFLNLAYNQLDGDIPAELGNLSNLIELYLSHNFLDGTIPEEIGSLSQLENLFLDYNRLLGPVPLSLVNLTNLSRFVIDYNRLSATGNGLLQFLETKNPEWQMTQTLPPMNVSAIVDSRDEIILTWQPISYTWDIGYYEIRYATNADGPFAVHGRTESKGDAGYPVTGLDAGTTYYFRVQTYSAVDWDLVNGEPRSWLSEFSETVSAQTVADSTPTPTATQTATPTSTPLPTSASTSAPTSAPTSLPSSTPTPRPSATPTPTLSTTPGSGDAYENDDRCDIASVIPINEMPQDHTFHSDVDQDWLRIDAVAGGTYRIEVQIPQGSSADVTLELYSNCESLPDELWNQSFAPGARLDFIAPSTGSFYVRMENSNQVNSLPGGTPLSEATAYQVSVRSLSEDPETGHVIIVAGRYRTTDLLQDNIHEITNAFYRTFLSNGYTSEDITYLATDSSLTGYDGPITAETLRLAIANAADDVSSEQALTLFIADHGDENVIYLDEPRGERLTPAQLNEWLTALETTVPGVPINVIIEACYAGSFIAGTSSTNISSNVNAVQNSISGPNRVIITSSNEDEVAYASRNGAYFSDYFITSLQQGRNLFTSFWEARDYVTNLFDFQSPWIDADGDGIPNEIDDANIAAQRGFAYAGTLSTGGGDGLWPPYIVNAQPPVEVNERRGTITAEVRDDRNVQTVWAVIYPPDYTHNSGGQELIAESLDTILLHRQGDDNFEGSYPGFDQLGTYRIVIHAQDADGLEARPVTVEWSASNESGGRLVYLPVISR
ncbi:MAG: fibronectin type III domain-containing protein [Chloroflexota bacterium]